MSSPSKKVKTASASAEPQNGRRLSPPKASSLASKAARGKACDSCRKKKIRCTHIDSSTNALNTTATLDPVTAKTPPRSIKKAQSPSSPNKNRKQPSPPTQNGLVGSPVLNSIEPVSSAGQAPEEPFTTAPTTGIQDTSTVLNTFTENVAKATDTDAMKPIPKPVSLVEKVINGNGTHEASIDKETWQGWCEIESEPANFNLMLKEYGVKGVRVKEVWSLDGLDILPQPVYGAILLFPYRDISVEKEAEACPDSLWFANQTAENACATTALLNLMLNVPDVDLGEPLAQFKEFTKAFTPFLRGQEIANFEFIKKIHNSWAKKTDILNVDLCMKNSYDARNKTSKKRKVSEVADEDEDDAYHFIAFVPLEGSVWRLDGLDKEPSRIGDVGDAGWLSVAAARIGAIMASVEAIGYTLLAIVRDPVEDLKQALAASVASMEELKGKEGVEEERSSLEAEQLRIQASISEEEWELEEEEAKVLARRHDYVPLVDAWVRMLAEKGVLKELLEGDA
ncbi:cysteine proteinase [Lophium mytilinum]|uniref:Ubiquitin carboxyl-terminal hydrolase n=1 Tax=Lophium mytilinum TaxID=390894 RepID=A0A6A6R5V1_9PEZI|nr:cysteine proteinase [Lophium mytilinum]